MNGRYCNWNKKGCVQNENRNDGGKTECWGRSMSHPVQGYPGLHLTFINIMYYLKSIPNFFCPTPPHILLSLSCAWFLLVCSLSCSTVSLPLQFSS